jgi:hypothetical protein
MEPGWEGGAVSMKSGEGGGRGDWLVPPGDGQLGCCCWARVGRPAMHNAPKCLYNKGAKLAHPTQQQGHQTKKGGSGSGSEAPGPP